LFFTSAIDTAEERIDGDASALLKDITLTSVELLSFFCPHDKRIKVSDTRKMIFFILGMVLKKIINLILDLRIER